MSNKLTRVLTVVVICCLPLLYLLINQEWLYAHPSSSDSIINQAFSFFYDVPEYKIGYYKASRVPWLALLFYLQKIVGPYLLTGFVIAGGWVITGLAYYFLLKNIRGHRVAILLLPWIVFFPNLVGINAGGGTYQNSGAVIYFILGLVAWTKEHEKSAGRYPILAGFLLASSIYTSIIYVHLLLLFPVLEIVRGRALSLKRYIHLFLGAIGATAFWGLVNYLHGRPFWFFQVMIDTFWTYMSAPEKQLAWWKPFSVDLFFDQSTGPYLCFHVSLLIISLIRVASVDRNRGFAQNILAWHFIFLSLLYGFWQAIGQTSLSPPDFIYPLQLPGFLMVADWLGKESEEKSFPHLKGILSATGLWFALYFTQTLRIQEITQGYGLLTIGYSLLMSGLLLRFIFPSPKWLKASALLFIGLTYSYLSVEPRHLNPYCKIRSEAHTALIDTIINIQQVEQNPRKVFVYGLEGLGSQDYHCLWTDMSKFIQNTWHIMGHSLGYKDSPLPRIEELNSESFEFIRERRGVLVLFPFRSEKFKEKFFARARDLGIEFDFVQSHSYTVVGQPVDYEIYRVR